MTTYRTPQVGEGIPPEVLELVDAWRAFYLTRFAVRLQQLRLAYALRDLLGPILLERILDEEPLEAEGPAR